MKTITNEKDLEGVQKMEEVKVVYPAEHLGKKYNSESECHFVGKLNNKDKSYFVVSLVSPSKEYKDANFVSSTIYGFGLMGQVKSIYRSVTGWSYKNDLEKELDNHFLILTRNPEDLE